MRLRDQHRCVRALSKAACVDSSFVCRPARFWGSWWRGALPALGCCVLGTKASTPLPSAPLFPCPAGDGAGILVAMPHIFLSHVVQAECGFELPPQGDYAVGQAFLPTDPEQYEAAKAAIAKVCGNQGHTLLGWRRVPTDNATLGESAVKTEPLVEQFFVLRATTEDMQQLSLERQVRRRGQEAGAGGSLWVWVWGTF